MSTENLKEFDLINKIKSWLDRQNLIVEIGDDAAAFNLNPKLITLFTTDSLVENVHFKIGSINAVDLGYKALTVNISDIAAMGGSPTFATVALGLPSKTEPRFVKELYKGFNDACEEYNLAIVGGDLSAAKELVINISLIGQVAKNLILRRDTAKIGDDILVTGSLGASAAGLKILGDTLDKVKDVPNKQVGYLLKKHFRPEARVNQAKTAAKLGVKTAIDVSDGLVSDCQRISEASRVGCKLLAEKIPIDRTVLSFATANKLNALKLALSGGEDYELIFTSPSKITPKLQAEFAAKKWPLSLIGKVNSSKKVEVIDKGTKPIKWQKSYEHKFN